MQLNSHDIRMKEFRRAILRGYSEEDVDTFLMHLAVDMDRLEREQTLAAVNGAQHNGGQHNAGQHSAGQHSAGQHSEFTVEPTPTTLSVADSEAGALQVAANTIKQAQDQARALYEAAKQAAHDLQHQTGLASTNTLNEARASAERGLTNARQRAEEILGEAREHQERASRYETEAGLRLAYVEQRLAKKALVLSEEAKRLAALADWLGQPDLVPDVDDLDELTDGVSGGNRPAHAAPSEGAVLPLRRSAD